MLLKEFELELQNESVRNLNPIPCVVWLAGNGIGINSRICLVRRKWNWNSLVLGVVAVVAATMVGGGDGGSTGNGGGGSVICGGGGGGGVDG
uniref:Uncharacterized protein n=1 Tax=Lactuca sativa TaxID=4236 RepID=A0A9R1V9L9_LACSA|nr:hypothetical protein LSAT_V11C600308460 [Lactuca sativa]